MSTNWDEKLNFLTAIRNGWCNTDYIEFLIQKVWKIEHSVDVIDFGCGFGYIGLLFMPLLPKGSTYTGIDMSDVLLKKAEEYFSGSPYKATFMQANLLEYAPSKNYDLAVSQAVLRHIPEYEKVLSKMIASVSPGGLVVCMETDRLLQEAGRYFSGFDYTELNQMELYKRIWNRELKSGGRDYRAGMKIPQLMQELGLHDVGVRINDCVKFANPHDKNYETVFHSLSEANGWNRDHSKEDKESTITYMISRGLSHDEAEEYYNNLLTVQNHVNAGHQRDFMIEMPCTPISFGRK